MVVDPTIIGSVQDVQGSTVTVELLAETATSLGFVNGESYRIGQVGSFVRIPLGYNQLYGVVSQVGAGAAPQRDAATQPYGNRWLRVQLVGEGRRNGRFERGISQHPIVDDPVHIVTQDDLRAIHGSGDPQDFVSIGRLASADAIPARIDVNKLVTRHAAVVGSTGAGKSTAVAGLLAALSDPARYPSSRIIVLDVHGEYAKALADRAVVFQVASEVSPQERPLAIPFWALSFDELVPLAFGNLSEAQLAATADAIVDLKREALRAQPRRGISADTVTVDSPIPFSIHRLWFELHQREHHTLIPKPGASSEEVTIAYVLDDHGQPVQLGDAMSVTPPRYRTVKTTGAPQERVQLGKDSLGIRLQLAGLATRLRDPRLAFLFRPADWLPQTSGEVARDLDELLASWIGGSTPVTILDLSGIPSGILEDLVGALLRILFDAVFWGRNLPEGGRERPLFLVLEEAHAYLGKDRGGAATAAVKRIAKEGRKYGIGIMLVSQRPSEIDATILSQCGTIVAMRLANDIDRGHIAAAVSDNLRALLEMLPALRTGEAIIVGEAVAFPVRAMIDTPAPNRRPDSADPRVVARGSASNGFDSPGGWNQRRDPDDYAAVMRQWRKQTAQYEHEPRRPHQPPESTEGGKDELDRHA